MEEDGQNLEAIDHPNVLDLGIGTDRQIERHRRRETFGVSEAVTAMVPVGLVSFQEWLRIVEIAGQQFHARPNQMLRHVIGDLRELLVALLDLIHALPRMALV